MRRFLRNIAIFFGIIIAIDFVYGISMDFLNSHAKSGGVAKRYYIAKQTRENILLFGSSRMSHHYDPKIIEDSFGLTCYNCGEDGNGIILSYGYLKMIIERYKPKALIYDISQFDVFESDNMKSISYLKPFCKEKGIMDIISKVSKLEKYKLTSSLYRYNSLSVRMIAGMVPKEEYPKGYIPFNETMNYEPPKNRYSRPAIDTLKVNFLKAFVSLCKSQKIKLYFFQSPCYGHYQNGYFTKEIYSIARSNNIRVFDHLFEPSISNDKSLFKDVIHLNNKGAELYTNIVVKDIKTTWNE